MFEELIEDICYKIAEGAVSACIDYMWGEPVNEGQETLVSELVEQAGDQVDAIANGEFEPMESNHPEAVGLIQDVGNAMLDEAAAFCDAIRAIQDITDLLDLA